MTEETNIIELTADIVSAYVANNAVPPDSVADLISSVNQALMGLEQPREEPKLDLVPAVSIKKSVTPDYIVSLENGRKFKSLRRHLMTSYGMTPAEYRTKWGLSKDYPMVAPNYASTRSELAKKLGLGRKAKAVEPEAAPEPKKGRGRPKKAQSAAE